MDGLKFDKFDAVIAYVYDVEKEDIEMKIDFYKYYSIAPVFAALHMEGLEPWMKSEIDDNTISVVSKEGSQEDIKKAVDQCKQLFEKILNEDVNPAFKQFDKDKSGVISK